MKVVLACLLVSVAGVGSLRDLRPDVIQGTLKQIG